MSAFFAVFTYTVLWWLTFLAILPIGVRSHFDAGIPTPGGGDPGSPVDPKLLRKVITTSWVAAIELAVVWAVISLHLVHLPELGG